MALSETEIMIALNKEHVIKCEFSSIELKSAASVITHRGKPLIRSGFLAKSAFDIELAAYLVNPGTRDLEIEELISRYLGISLSPASSDLFSSSFNPELVAYLFDWLS